MLPLRMLADYWRKYGRLLIVGRIAAAHGHSDDAIYDDA